MAIDIAIIVIVGLFMLLGLKNGFFYTLFRALGWIAALVLAVMFTQTAATQVKVYTPFYDIIYGRVKDYCLSFVNSHVGSHGTGTLFGINLGALTDQAASRAAAAITDFIIDISVFVLIVILVKLILFLITMLFSKKNHRGFIGGVDGLLGMVLGFVQGAVVVLILLAIMMPVSYAISPSLYDQANNALDHSMFSYSIWEANPVRTFLGTFSPENFLPLLSTLPGPGTGAGITLPTSGSIL